MNQNVAMMMALTKVKGLGPKTLLPYIKGVTLSDVDKTYHLLTQIRAEHSRIKEIPSYNEFCESVKEAQDCLNKQEQLGIKAIGYGEKDYPSGFKELAKPPMYFFYKGNKEALFRDGIAVIGTRNVTPYTEKVGEHMGKYLAKKKWTVISGLAIGSDASGHRGCLEGNGVTVAIVGTPLDTVYPKKNAPLQEELLKKGGCVISEYPIGTPFIARHLVERDRLQSGLAKGVFVIATGEKGGTWNAINEAVSLEKPIAFFDYTKSKYNDKADEHTQGMDKMIKAGAKGVYHSIEIDKFLKQCARQKEYVTSLFR